MCPLKAGHREPLGRLNTPNQVAVSRARALGPSYRFKLTKSALQCVRERIGGEKFERLSKMGRHDHSWHLTNVGDV